ncbi:response regulator transcription factor [bacterium]|nr:response regulator transcription factor [bacterium]
MTDIRVVVVDDHVIVREGLKALLELEPDIQVVYGATSSMECLEILDEYSPHVVLMDLKMPGIGGIEATRLIKRSRPQIKVILLTNYDDEAYVVEAIKAEADGYVLKDVKEGELVRILRLVNDGHSYIDPSVTNKVFQQLKGVGLSGQVIPRSILSQRELQILECLVDGESNQQIAESVCLSLDTVKSHLKNIYQKLGVSKRSQAIKAALREGLVYLSK